MSVVHKERSTLTLDDFKGVDFSTSPFNVASNRAVEMENMINIDGVNQKRPGWESVLNLNGRVNGIYHIPEESVLIVHNGTCLYAYEVDTWHCLASISNDSYDGVHIKDTQSQFFIMDGKVVIVCGDVIVYDIAEGRFYTIDSHPHVYVPTTNIIYGTRYMFSSETEDNYDRAPEFRGEEKEKVNLLTRKRINYIEAKAEDEEFATSEWGLFYVLDANVVPGSTVKVERLNEDGSSTTFINMSGRALAAMYPVADLYQYSTIQWYFDKQVFLVPRDYIEEFDNSSYDWEDFTGMLMLGYFWEDGYVTEQFECNQSCIHIKNSTKYVYDALDMKVEFTPVSNSEEDLSERIRCCTIGTLSGVSDDANNTDILFLTGSDAQKNGVYYSQFGNYLYFPDLNYFTVGNSGAEVTGFLRLPDDTMAIFKDGKNGDTCIYYATGEIEKKYDSSGEFLRAETNFTVWGGNNGEKCVSHSACACLAGDSLMLSENGVYGITFVENVTTNARYVRERSFNINERLKKHNNLSSASAIAYKNRYYLSVDGVCYVADPRFKFYRDTQIEQSYNYEWWYWTGVDARCFAVVDGSLWFGTSDGKICKFKDGEYTDDTFVQLTSAEIYTDSDKIIFSNQYIDYIHDGDECTLVNSDNLYSKAAFCKFTDESHKFETSYEAICKLIDGDRVYAGLFSDGLMDAWCGRICDIDLANCTFCIYETIGEDGYEYVTEDLIPSVDDCFYLYRSLNDEKMIVTNVVSDTDDYTSFQLKSSETGDIVDIEGHDPSGNYTMRITHKDNVVSRWITPYFDMGSNVYSKTLLGMTICTFPSVGERLRFGYQTKKGVRMTENKGVSFFGLDNTAFDLFSFDTSFADSYTKKVNVRDFNYIRFTFVSDGPHNCAVNNFTALYKINRKNRGVR